MPQSLAKILLHLVFSTKERRPLLRDRAFRGEMYRYIGGILNGMDCPSIIVGGLEDHVHLLCVLSRTCAPADMVKEVKRSSSLWIKTRASEFADFAWQSGYGVFSIGYSQIEEVRRYIADQEEHYNKLTFQDEFRRLLKRYDLTFDEAYVWD
jgi:REP element-mobilizing transposase RayT